MYREQSEQSEPTPARDPELVSPMHLRAVAKVASEGLKDKSGAMSSLTIGFLVAFILSALLIGPVLFLPVAAWAKLSSGSLIVICAIGTALTQLGYRRRRSLGQELKMRLVDVEQCSDARQEHYIRRALATVKKANDHLGVES